MTQNTKNSSIALCELLSISIATKDRLTVVNETLHKIHGFGLSECPLLICDDGSTPAFKSSAMKLFPRAKLIRNDTPRGQAIGRNQIAAACETPYLLQLDDDSYPIAGSIEKLIDFAESRDDWIAIAIPFEEPARGREFQSEILKSEASEVRAFVGCSVLIHVENFRRVGGYASWIGRTGEEEELCLRSIDKDFCILKIDHLRIRHEVTEVGRNRSKIQLRSIFNWTSIWIRSAPFAYCIYRLGRLLMGSAFIALRSRSFQPITAYFRAIFSLENWKERSVLKKTSIQRFVRLPHALDSFKVTS